MRIRKFFWILSLVVIIKVMNREVIPKKNATPFNFKFSLICHLIPRRGGNNYVIYKSTNPINQVTFTWLILLLFEKKKRGPKFTTSTWVPSLDVSISYSPNFEMKSHLHVTITTNPMLILAFIFSNNMDHDFSKTRTSCIMRLI